MDEELAREALGHVDALYRLARYLTGRDGDAEDLVQETYARAVAGAAGFTPGTNLKAWLFRILRNTFVSGYRRQRNDPTVGGFDTVDPGDHASRDDSWLRGKLVVEDIERAMLSLGEDARTVILLDLEGLTEAEVAAVVGCPVGTVKSRLARARATLRQRLSDYCT